MINRLMSPEGDDAVGIAPSNVPENREDRGPIVEVNWEDQLAEDLAEDAGTSLGPDETPEGGGTVSTPTETPGVPPSSPPTPAVPPAPVSGQPAQPTAPGTPSQPAQPAVQAAPPASQVPAQPSAATPTAPTEAPAQPAAQPETPPAGPTSVELREQFRGVLEQQYQLNEEDSDLMITDPAKVIPKLATKLHLGVTEAVTYGIMNVLPQLFEQWHHQREETAKHEKTFFDAWPKLNTPEGRQAVKQMGGAWRQLNPTASAEQFMREVGAASMVALRIPIDGAVEAPAAPVVNAPPPPPAAPGGAAPLPSAPQSKNTFTIMAEEDLRGN